MIKTEQSVILGGLVKHPPFFMKNNSKRFVVEERKNSSEVYPFDSRTGYLKDTVPQFVLDELWSEVRKSKDNDLKYNHNLVGSIEEEYFIDPRSTPLFSKYMGSKIAQFEKEFRYLEHQYNIFGDSPPPPCKIGSLWVNFQKKGEYNCPHTHDGTHSFVLWLQIPYDLKDEFATPNNINSRRSSKGMGATNSAFGFINYDDWNQVMIRQLDVDHDWENKIIIFPSYQVHYVNPFYTSNEYRISLSGNIHFHIESHERPEYEKVPITEPTIMDEKKMNVRTNYPDPRSVSSNPIIEGNNSTSW